MAKDPDPPASALHIPRSACVMFMALLALQPAAAQPLAPPLSQPLPAKGLKLVEFAVRDLTAAGAHYVVLGEEHGHSENLPVHTSALAGALAAAKTATYSREAHVDDAGREEQMEKAFEGKDTRADAILRLANCSARLHPQAAPRNQVELQDAIRFGKLAYRREVTLKLLSFSNPELRPLSRFLQEKAAVSVASLGFTHAAFQLAEDGRVRNPWTGAFLEVPPEYVQLGDEAMADMFDLFERAEEQTGKAVLLLPSNALKSGEFEAFFSHYAKEGRGVLLVPVRQSEAGLYAALLVGSAPLIPAMQKFAIGHQKQGVRLVVADGVQSSGTREEL